MQPDDTLDAVLRPLRNQVFHFASFDEARFVDDHCHCVACRKIIAGPEHADVQHDGYVTWYEVHDAGFPAMKQYAWACNACFPRYRDSYGWKISAESIPEVSPTKVSR